nr:hypothetical protein [uncultured Dongia sp.]
MFASIDRLTGRLARQAILLVMSACLSLAAAGMAAAALYYWLLDWMPQPQALGLVALVLLILGLILAVAAQGGKKSKVAAQAAQSNVATGIPALAAMASDAASAAVKADPLGAMLGASAIGFILESRPDLDHALLQQVLRQFTR